MKKLLLGFFILLLVFIGMNSFGDETSYKFEINRETSQEELNKIQQDLKTRDIILNFEKLRFNKKGNIKSIQASMLYKNDTLGAFSAFPFNKVKVEVNSTATGPSLKIKVNSFPL